MRTPWPRLFPPPAALLLLALVVACDRPSGSVSPLDPAALAPSFESSESEEDGELVTEEPYTGPTRAAAWIGPSGGSLSLADHGLVVPEGAIAEAMCFTMELLSGDYVDVGANAWQMSSSEDCKAGDGQEEGMDGVLWQGTFETPVILSLTYSRATNVSDPSTLQVVYMKSASELVPLDSELDPGLERVSAELDHFSAYALATF